MLIFAQEAFLFLLQGSCFFSRRNKCCILKLFEKENNNLKFQFVESLVTILYLLYLVTSIYSFTVAKIQCTDCRYMINSFNYNALYSLNNTHVQVMTDVSFSHIIILQMHLMQI